jgi:hypothetical protein
MSLNIQKPGDYINGPLTVVGAVTLNSTLTVSGVSVFNNNVGIGIATPNVNANRSTLTLQGAWGGQVDINVGATNHAQFGSDNFSSGASCRIQSLDHIAFKTNNGAVLGAFLNANGVFSLQNAVSNANGIGIAFPAAQSASTNANTLDDYEEGTWTGTLKGSTTDPTVAVTATGRYTKVGRQVSVQIEFNNVSTAGASGNVFVIGLPFANSSIAGCAGSVITFLTATFTETLGCIIGGVSTAIDIYSVKSNSSWVAATHNAGTGRYLWLNITYTV